MAAKKTIVSNLNKQVTDDQVRSKHTLLAAKKFRNFTRDLGLASAESLLSRRALEAVIGTVVEKSTVSKDSLRTLDAIEPIDEILTLLNQDIAGHESNADEEPLSTDILKEFDLKIDDLAQIDLSRGLSIARHEAALLPGFTASGIVSSARNIEPALRFGPFRDRFQRDIFIDLFQPLKKVALRPAAGGKPVLLATRARLSPSNSRKVNLQKGTIWIAAKSLNSNAPAGAYVGIRIKGGTITLAKAATRDNDDLILSASNKKFALKLRLEQDEPVSPRITALPPKELEISFSAQATPETFERKASIDSSEFAFKGDKKIRYDSRKKQIIFSCAVQPATLETGKILSAGAKFQGKIQLSKGGWALPITLPATVNDLAEAAGENAWSIDLNGDFEAAWQGGPDKAVTVHKSSLVIQKEGFAIDAVKVSPNQKGDSHNFQFWKLQGSSHRLRFEARLDQTFEALMGWSEKTGSILVFDASCSFRFGRPLTASGGPASIADADVKVHITGPSSDQNLLILRRAPHDPADVKRQMMVLENAYLSTDVLQFAVIASKLRNGVETFDGYAGFFVPVLGWIPILPDPYVDNLCPSQRAFAGRERKSMLAALFSWKDGSAECDFYGRINGLSSRLCSPSKGGSRPMSENDKPPIYDGQTQQGAAIRAPFSDTIAFDHRGLTGFVPDNHSNNSKGTPSETSLKAQRAFTKMESGSRLRVPGPMLLDVSTSRHHMGVQMAQTGQEQLTHAVATTGAYLIHKSRLNAPLSALRVFALPQIQWEPVRTLEKDQDPITLGIFPTPLASPDDGGATVIGSNTSTLAPIIPDLTLDEVLRDFAEGNSFGVVTTLPFGMKTLFRVRGDATAARLPDTAEYVRPKFDQPNMLEGGLQLSLRSEGGAQKPGRESPSFEGLAVQTLNGVDLNTGSGLNISVLGATVGSAGSVESLFNGEFALARPRAPITRYDISGYGASTFSDWTNPKGSFAEATRAQFQVIVGRTALEIVKVASIVYPWGIRVTRSVTIERKGGGGVIRRDSGWQAQSSGVFDFTTDTVPTQPFEFHPGLIRGVFNATRIRPLANDGIDLPGGAQVLPIAFDADVKLDGRVGGGLTPAKGMTGYLHLKPVGGPITPAALAALIDHQGTIGGPVDDMINVGGSGFKARALRIEIDTVSAPAPAPGNVGFVGAVKVAPRFSAAGAWSVSQASSPSGSAPYDASGVIDGTPVIRTGKANPSPDGDIRAPLSGPYRFANARDLYQPANPDVDYGFVQSDTTHRFLYRRPKIEPGDAMITSDLPPVFVDFFAATSSKGLFPPVSNAIELADHAYHLDIQASTGFLGLVPDVDISPPRGQLVLSDSATDRFRIEYGDSALRYSLEPDDWSLEFDRLELWTDAGGWDNLNGTRVTLRGGEGRRSELDKIETLMNPIMEDLFSVLPFMNDRGIHGPVDLGATNLKVGLKFSAGVDKYFPKDNPYVAIRLFALLELGLDIDVSGPEVFYLGGKTGYEARFSIPIDPYPVAVIFGWGMTLGGKVLLSGPDTGKTKGLVEVRIYVGLAFGKDLGPFRATVTTGAGLLIVGGSETGLGGFIFLEIIAKISPIVKLKVFGEFSCLQIEKASGDKYHRWKGEVGINVSIFMIISIKFTANVSDEKKI